tara:strand:+ start:3600 stop:4853 length:1254 start_codon:yes stop_codon:yes gene_type:complete
MQYSQTFFNTNKKILVEDKKKLIKVHKKIIKLIKNYELPCVSIVNENSDIKSINTASDKFKNCDHILLIGTGGSSLGGKTLNSLRNNQFVGIMKPNIYFIENVDPTPIIELLNQINVKKTGFIVISKSGETIETLSQFFLIYDFLKKKVNNISSKTLIITENKNSTLKKIQEKINADYLPHDNNIGGRFSIFSNVGLLPARLSSLDIKKIRTGGQITLKNLLYEKDVMKIKPVMGSVINYSLFKSGINQCVLMPYSDALYNFSLWFRQLWGESIGKKGLGSTPINSIGTIDQHSQLQLYLDGPKNKIITIIGINKLKSSPKLNTKISKNFVFETLEGKSMNSLLKAEENATFDTLISNNIPTRKINLPVLNEINLGALLMHFFLETIYTCFLLDVDPFDQPAVEEGKILTKKYLNNA